MHARGGGLFFHWSNVLFCFFSLCCIFPLLCHLIVASIRRHRTVHIACMCLLVACFESIVVVALDFLPGLQPTH